MKQSVISKVFEFVKRPYKAINSMDTTAPEFTALERQFDAVAKINDVAERVLAADDLRNIALAMETDRLFQLHPLAIAPSFVVPGLILGAIAAPFVAMPLLPAALIGLSWGMGATALASLMARTAFKNDDKSLNLAEKVRRWTSKLIENAPKSDNILGVAQSPDFDTVMQKFPDMKEAFLLASTKAQRAKSPQLLSVATHTVSREEKRVVD